MPPDMRELGVLRIASPCPARWSNMRGDDRVRFCGKCNLNVYNLENLSSEEARELVRSHEGRRLCVRFWRRADGRVMTADCGRGFKFHWESAVYRFGLVTAVLIACFMGFAWLFGDNIRRLYGMTAGDALAGAPAVDEARPIRPPAP